MFSNRAKFDTLRSVAAGSVTASYAALGTALGAPAVAVNFQNNTNGDVKVSLDGINDQLYLPANSYQVWDIRTNSPYLGDYLIPQGTVFYVKQGTVVPATGAFYIEVLLLTNATAVAVAQS
jgi:hypothetical protein